MNASAHPIYRDADSVEIEPSTARWIVLPLFGIGAFLRIYQYLWDRSLWVDEAALANNIIARGFVELAAALSDNQAAPLGFLYLERISVLVAGPGELSLRFIPFAASLIALPLFWIVARRLLSPTGALVALGLFAVSSRVIYYAAEVKQYSLDIAVGLALVALYLRTRDAGLDRSSAIRLGLAGAVGVWFSQTLVFYLAAIGITLALEHRTKIKDALLPLSITAGCWIGSFAGSHAISRRMISEHHAFLDAWWGSGFLPLPPTSLADMALWGSAFVRLFRDPLGFTLPVLAAAACLAGVLWMVGRRRGADALLLMGPVALTMLAAGLRLYPFGDTINHAGRVLLFLAPVVLILVAHGAAETARAMRVTPAILALALVAPFTIVRVEPAMLVPVYRNLPAAVHWVFIPPLPRFDIDSQPVGQVLERVASIGEPEDRYYVYTIAGPTFAYYAGRLGIPPSNYVRGAAEGTRATDVTTDLQGLRGSSRIWVFFAYAPGDIPTRFIQELNAMGELLMVIEDGPVGALLYDLSGT